MNQTKLINITNQIFSQKTWKQMNKKTKEKKYIDTPIWDSRQQLMQLKSEIIPSSIYKVKKSILILLVKKIKLDLEEE